MINTRGVGCSSSMDSTSSYDSDSYASSSASIGDSDDGSSLALLQQLESEMEGNLHTDVDLALFAREVCGLDEVTVKKLLSMTVTLDQTVLAEYKQGKSEDDGLESFWVMARPLLGACLEELGQVAGGTFSETFPGCLARNAPVVDGHHRVGAATSLICSTVSANILMEFRCLSDQISDNQGEEKEQPLSSQNVVHTAIENHGVVDVKGSHPDNTITPQSTLKRRFDLIKGIEDEPSATSKRQRRECEDALRNCIMPLYAMESLAATCRYYVVGMVVDRLNVTVCYFDRFLVACSTSFSFAREPTKLALVLYAMSRRDIHPAGSNPHLVQASPRAVNQDPEEDQALVDSIVGSRFEYHTDGASNTRSNANCDTGRTIAFEVTEVIRRPQELIGRATSVYKVRQLLADGTLSKEEYALKLSWPLESSISEIDVVKALKERLPKEAHDHIPDLIFASTWAARELNLPCLRLNLDLSGESFRPRVLRGMAGKLYHKLWEAGSIENFKQVWLDCVECLYLAYKHGKVLHRDISEDNIMVLKLPDGTVKGVLNDWDTATFLDGEERVMGSGDCVGTPPFMAIDHLKKPSTRHYLRHSLESLLYILIWAALHYNLTVGKRDRYVHPLIEAWTMDARSNWKNKAFILCAYSSPMEDLLPAIKTEFAEIFRDWVDPLRKLITRAKTVHCFRTEDLDEETFGGLLTFRSFLGAIKVTPRSWGIPKYLDDGESL